MTKPEYDSLCLNAELYYYDILCGPEGSRDIPATVIRHVEECAKCQEKMSKLKSALSETSVFRSELKDQRTTAVDALELHMGLVGKPVTCKTVRPLLPSLARQQPKAPTPVTVHLDACGQCRKNLETIRDLNLSSEQLQRLSVLFEGKLTKEDVADAQVGLEGPSADRVLAMVEEPESGVVTVYNLDDAEKAEGVYSGCPITVESIGQEDQTSPTRKKELLPPWSKTAIKAALAAVVIIAVSFLLIGRPTDKISTSMAPPAKKITISGIFETILKTQNLQIATFTPERADPVKREWVSRASGIYMVEHEKGYDFLDVNKLTLKAGPVGSRPTDRISVLSFTNVRRMLTTTFDLTPFPSASRVPADAQWIQITDETKETNYEDAEIYELRWSEKQRDRTVIFRKWRVYVKPETNLPMKVEFYIKPPAQSDYKLETTNVISYPTDSEFQKELSEYPY